MSLKLLSLSFSIQKVIPEFAATLATRDLGNRTMLTGYGINLTSDLHRHGISCRHLGLLRTYFWRPVQGSVNIAYNSSLLDCTSSGDLRSQIRKGDLVVLHTEQQRINASLGHPSEHYKVATGEFEEHSARRITLETTLKVMMLVRAIASRRSTNVCFLLLSSVTMVLPTPTTNQLTN